MIAKRLAIAAVAAVTLFTANVSTVTPAAARDDGAVAAGAAAGLVGGMLLGGALANQGRVYEDEPVVVHRRRPVRVYEEEEVVRPRRCWREEWRDRWGDYHERRVCR